MATVRQTSQTVCGVATGHAERRGAFIPSQMVLLPATALYSVSNRPNHSLCPHHLNNSRLELGLEFVWESFNHAKLDAIAPHCKENIRTTRKQVPTRMNRPCWTKNAAEESIILSKLVPLRRRFAPKPLFLASRLSYSKLRKYSEKQQFLPADAISFHSIGDTFSFICRRRLISVFRRILL